LLPVCVVLLACGHSCNGSLMSRIGLTLGGRPAHENQIDHTRRIPWAVKEMMEEEQAKQQLPFIKKADVAVDGDRPPPCVGICYYHKLQALQAREEMTRHNQILKEDCESGECTADYKADADKSGPTMEEDEEAEAVEMAVDTHVGASVAIQDDAKSEQNETADSSEQQSSGTSQVLP